MDDFSVGRSIRSLFDSGASNVFAVKWSYWFNP
jgi:hypothetical protein